MADVGRRGPAEEGQREEEEERDGEEGMEEGQPVSRQDAVRPSFPTASPLVLFLDPVAVLGLHGSSLSRNHAYSRTGRLFRILFPAVSDPASNQLRSPFSSQLLQSAPVLKRGLGLRKVAEEKEEMRRRKTYGEGGEAESAW